MASMFGALPNTVRLLDAGAGVGALTTAFLARRRTENVGLRLVHATLFEVDPLLIDPLSTAMNECTSRCGKAGIQFTCEIHHGDFIQEMSARLAGGFFADEPPTFDAAIINPPYRKIGASAKERRVLSSLGIETSNLHTAFVSPIRRLLAPSGQMVGITPRSFCNGPYFRAFREDFLSDLELRRLHVFESRHAAFRADSVLQENVIFHAVKGKTQPRNIDISSSSGEPDGVIRQRTFPFSEVVHPHDTERFIHIPSAQSHEDAKQALRGLSAALTSLGLTISTGRVVDFRLKPALRKEPGPGTAPLIYPCHFNGGTIHWPKLDARKPNAILDNSDTRPSLVPAGIYLLTKRFTSKEEKRRIVACLYDPSEVDAPWIGFENHLNYFHASGQGLGRELAKGLFAFLNSTAVDQYFRRFSGHTQVNATDLRTLAYPSRGELEAIGEDMKSLDLSQDEIDELILRHLNAND